MPSFILTKITTIIYIYYVSYALPRLPLNLQLESTGKQVKQDVLNNVNSTLNKNHSLFHIVNFRF